MVHLGSIVHGPAFMVVTTIATCAGAVLLKVWTALTTAARPNGTSGAGRTK